MAKLSSKNQITIPVDVLRETGLEPGDDVAIRPVGPGKIEIQRRSDRAREIIERFAGSMTYPPGYLDELRDEWER